MLKRRTNTQSELEFVSIETLVPKDHLLRKIDRHIDFSFIYDKVEESVLQRQRPAAGRRSIRSCCSGCLVGYLYGVRLERRLEQEIKFNVAYRWLPSLGLGAQVPGHSTISRNRIDRFAGTDIFQ